MAIVAPKLSYNVVRSRYTDLANRYVGAAKPRPEPPKRDLDYSREKEQAKKVRYASGQAEKKPTGGSAPQYRGEFRAMSATEKKLYAYNKREDLKKEAASGTSKEIKAK